MTLNQLNAQYKHSHTKRNSLDTRAVFIEFSEYVNNSGVVVCLLRGHIFLKELYAGDDNGRIFAFLHNNMLIAIVTAKRF